MFRFHSPEYLWFLLLIPVVIALFAYVQRRRKARLAVFGDEATVSQLIPEASPKRWRTKFVVCTVAFSLLMLSLARPQFGSKLKEVTRDGIEIMLAVDVSNSMLAQDFEPNRLERTKYAINRLLEKLVQDQIGLIVFAGDAYIQLPITSDYVTARNFANRISTGMVSRQGTAMGAAINLAASSFSADSEGSRVIILISDGENHEDDAIGAAKRAAEMGIKIYTIGIGTPEGAPISINGELVRDSEGNIVVTKLDETTLEQIALVTDGAYIRSTNQSVGLTEIITRINETDKKALTAMVFEEYNEQFQYLLSFALALLLIDVIIISRKNRILSKFNIFTKSTEQR